MKMRFYRVIAVAFICAVVFSISCTASADTVFYTSEGMTNAIPSPPPTYEKDQYYLHDDYNVEVYTVQVSAGPLYEGAVKRRMQMLNAGYDAFIYEKDGLYRTMCGKFRDRETAVLYSESIHVTTDRSEAYVTHASLPEDAIVSFAAVFYRNDTSHNYKTLGETYWEKPSGDFFRASEENTVKVYTVQFSAGPSFSGAERNRSKMMSYGYQSFVYKKNLMYRVMTGAFWSEEEAKKYCEQIHQNTDQQDAYVTTALLPEWYVAEMRQQLERQ